MAYERIAGGVLTVHERILGKNDEIARQNRERFREAGLLALNLVSSPGSGKTALIERMLPDLRGQLRIGVVVGDPQTDNDARRIAQAGGAVAQIVTQSSCHLEADMVARALESLDLAQLDILIIENVGNLVCPAAFDLGEGLRVAILSVTEGEDKPLKYPVMFHSAQIVLINKTDLAEVVEFDRQATLEALESVAPDADVFEVSARTGAGLSSLYERLWHELQRVREFSPR